jgi:hypothetical protein
MKPNPQAFDVSVQGTPKYALVNFNPEEFMAFWPHIEGMLDKLTHTWKYWTKDWIFAAATSGTLQVWGIGPPPDAIFIFFTQISIHPAMRVLNVTWGAGTFQEEMLPLMHATLVNYAKMNSCSEIAINGRPGWDKMFKSIGMKREHVTWSLPIPDMRMN